MPDRDGTGPKGKGKKTGFGVRAETYKKGGDRNEDCCRNE